MSAITWNQSVITDFRPPWAMNLLTPTAPDWRCSVKHPLQGTPPLVAHRPAASWCWWLPQSWRMHLQHWPGQWWYSTSWPSPQIWKLGRGTGGWSLVASLETLSCVKKRPASWRDQPIKSGFPFQGGTSLAGTKRTSSLETIPTHSSLTFINITFLHWLFLFYHLPEKMPPCATHQIHGPSMNSPIAPPHADWLLEDLLHCGQWPRWSSRCLFSTRGDFSFHPQGFIGETTGEGDEGTKFGKETQCFLKVRFKFDTWLN